MMIKHTDKQELKNISTFLQEYWQYDGVGFYYAPRRSIYIL